MILEIKGLKLNDLEINLTFLETQRIGLFGKNKELIKNFLELLSGINNNHNTIYIDKDNIFENKEYLNSRVFFDFSKNYLTTLRVNKIEEVLKIYNLEFDKEKFINICKDLNVRGETDISYKYEFSKTGNTFVNLALLCSVNKKNIIVNNPTTNLNLDMDIEYFVNKLTSLEFNRVILGLNNLRHFKNKLDKIVLFTDFDSYYELRNSDSIIIFDKDIDKHFLIKNKLFKSNYLIALNNYSKDELANFKKMKVKYEIANIYDLEKYLVIDNE